MTPLVLNRPQAEQDLIHHYAYIGRNDEHAADRFLLAVQAAFQLLARFPLMGASWESPTTRLRGIRAWTVPKYRY